jgi:hypothetical protein
MSLHWRGIGRIDQLLTVLIAANAVMQQHSTLVDLQTRLCDADAGLMLALGGGYVPSPEDMKISKTAIENVAKVPK